MSQTTVNVLTTKGATAEIAAMKVKSTKVTTIKVTAVELALVKKLHFIKQTTYIGVKNNF
jgi:hypothetical protein